MIKLYLKTKLKNDLCRLLPETDLKFSINNIIVNHDKRGCSGHITYVPNGRCIYVNTERSCLSSLPPAMFRYAKDEKDYSSSGSEFSAANIFTTYEKLAGDIVYALTCPKEKIKSITKDINHLVI